MWPLCRTHTALAETRTGSTGRVVAQQREERSRSAPPHGRSRPPPLLRRVPAGWRSGVCAPVAQPAGRRAVERRAQLRRRLRLSEHATRLPPVQVTSLVLRRRLRSTQGRSRLLLSLRSGGNRRGSCFWHQDAPDHATPSCRILLTSSSAPLRSFFTIAANSSTKSRGAFSRCCSHHARFSRTASRASEVNRTLTDAEARPERYRHR